MFPFKKHYVIVHIIWKKQTKLIHTILNSSFYPPFVPIFFENPHLGSRKTNWEPILTDSTLLNPSFSNNVACVYRSKDRREPRPRRSHAGVRTMNDERRENSREAFSKARHRELVHCHANSARTPQSSIIASPLLPLSSSLPPFLLFFLPPVCFLNNVTRHSF